MAETSDAHDIAWFQEMLSNEERRRSWYASVRSTNDEIRAFESVCDEAELQPASSGAPLEGLPFGVKDLFVVDGHPTTAGSALPAELFDGPEAPSVRRLRDAGARVLGKAKTDEFAYAAPPDTLNPRDLQRTPGGSSAGSAAAVASGMCPFALGTQTSRSIVAPASFCGVVGFKPSHQRVPLDGVVPLAPSMDTLGVLASSVSDAATVAQVLIEDWRGTRPDAPGAVGVLTADLRKLLLEGTSAFPVYEEFIAARSLPTVPFRWERDVERVFLNGMDLLHGEMAVVHRDWFSRFEDRYQEITRNGVLRGQAIGEERLQEVREWAISFRTEVEEDLKTAGVDVLLLPSQPQEAPPLGQATGFGHTTTPWSAAGLPCLSVPALAVNGLPLGLQGVAAFGQDEELLSVLKRPGVFE